ncbi:MAG: hypothetical protein KF764_30565 [Labilithrix sp.]|nr:hypothetical protein [Labilithrix sp.]
MKRSFGMVVVLLSVVVGCAGRPASTPAAHAPRAHDPSSHNHDRGHMMIASNGVVDALLTSHLSSTDGNELDVFVEKNGVPLALTTTRLEATAHLRGEARVLAFACAPDDERPAGEAAGTCSHFVARAAWMTPEDRLEVATSLPLLRGDVAYTWRDFDPRRYAHHVE